MPKINLRKLSLLAINPVRFGNLALKTFPRRGWMNLHTFLAVKYSILDQINWHHLRIKI